MTLVAGFMSLLDVTIVAVALPTVQNDLGASPAEVQWVVSGYALTFALALVTAGRLGDALDRRKIFLIALCAFVLCSAACGAAPASPCWWWRGSRRAWRPVSWRRRTRR